MLKRKIISDLERWRHKGEACLGFTPQIEICGDPLTDKEGSQPLSTISINYFYIIKNAQPCRSAMPAAMRELSLNGSFEYYSTLHSSPPLLSVPND